MRYLFTMSVGPVQGFIAAARRTRDLWAGSWLLSEVAKAAAHSLHQVGAELIFPYPLSVADLHPGSKFIAVNKILALVEVEEPAVLAARAKAAARDRLRAAAANLGDLGGTTYDQQRFDQQLDDFLEFYCAWTPHAQDQQYARDRERVETLFLARKSLNSFMQHKGVPGLPKSSLDGTREHVIVKRGPRLLNSQLKENEYLDAVGLVKRFTRTPAGRLRFESTIDIAAVPYRLGLENNPKCGSLVAEYVQFLQEHELAHQTSSLLYEHESRQLFDQLDEDYPELVRIRKALYDAHGKPNPPYYALLLADGDHMGACIDAIADRRLHQEFSQRLSEFAAEAFGLIEGEPYRGCPVYVGGDDILALLPLHHAVECVAKLRDLFLKKMDGPWPRKPTFSAGLAVAHALEPLTEVREIARRAEGDAKDARKGDRDALAIIQIPRSGPETSAYGKFGDFPAVLLRIVELYARKELSLGFAHELRELLARTPEALGDVASKIALEAARRKEASQAALELLAAANTRDQLERLYRIMLVARPFYRAKREAGL